LRAGVGRSNGPAQWNQLDEAFFSEAAKSTVVDFVDSAFLRVPQTQNPEDGPAPLLRY
jgi:hypothetical protein